MEKMILHYFGMRLCKNSSLDTPRRRKPRRFWSKVAEKIFIDLWMEKIGELKGPRKNTDIYEEMAKEMADKGINISVRHIKHKLDSLTRKYKHEKIAEESGTTSIWPLYKKISAILSTPPTRPSKTTATNLDEFVEEIITKSDPSNYGEYNDPLIFEPKTHILEESINTSSDESVVIKKRKLGKKNLLSRLDKCNWIAEKTARSIQALAEASYERNEILRVIALNQEKLISLMESNIST